MTAGEYRKRWNKNIPLAGLYYNTPYHTCRGCEPTTVFYSRVSYNILDHKLRLKFNPNPKVTKDFADEELGRKQN